MQPGYTDATPAGPRHASHLYHSSHTSHPYTAGQTKGHNKKTNSKNIFFSPNPLAPQRSRLKNTPQKLAPKVPQNHPQITPK